MGCASGRRNRRKRYVDRWCWKRRERIFRIIFSLIRAEILNLFSQADAAHCPIEKRCDEMGKLWSFVISCGWLKFTKTVSVASARKITCSMIGHFSYFWITFHFIQSIFGGIFIHKSNLSFLVFYFTKCTRDSKLQQQRRFSMHISFLLKIEQKFSIFWPGFELTTEKYHKKSRHKKKEKDETF